MTVTEKEVLTMTTRQWHWVQSMKKEMISLKEDHSRLLVDVIATCVIALLGPSFLALQEHQQTHCQPHCWVAQSTWVNLFLVVGMFILFWTAILMGVIMALAWTFAFGCLAICGTLFGLLIIGCDLVLERCRGVIKK